MRKIIFASSLFLTVLVTNSIAQEAKSVREKPATEKYGKTLNLDVGIGYYGYIGHFIPVGTINFEFDVAKKRTRS